MGAWGTAIFSDDYASDVKDEYLFNIMNGKTSEEATDNVKEKLLSDDSDSIAIFWIALATIQWKKGRLLGDVKNNAIKHIDQGGDLALWEESGQSAINKRKEALEKTKAMLLSEMPAPKKISKPYWMKSDPWKLGDVLAFKIERECKETIDYVGKYILLRVINFDYDKKYDCYNALYSVYNWCGDLSETDKPNFYKNLSFLKIMRFEYGPYDDVFEIKFTKREVKYICSLGEHDYNNDPFFSHYSETKHVSTGMMLGSFQYIICKSIRIQSESNKE